MVYVCSKKNTLRFSYVTKAVDALWLARVAFASEYLPAPKRDITLSRAARWVPDAVVAAKRGQLRRRDLPPEARPEYDRLVIKYTSTPSGTLAEMLW